MRRGDRTVLADLYQEGSAKARFPKVVDGGPPEAVLINLAGGVTGADRFRQRVDFGEATHGLVTTQAAEKIYRASGGSAPARITNSLTVGLASLAEWLPQETILFDGGRLQRRFAARLDPTARLIACEALIFGRTAMGETVESGAIRDEWRIHVGERLVFADALHLDGHIQNSLDRPATARGAKALATFLYVGADAERLLEPARAALAGYGEDGRRAAVSRLGCVLHARFIAGDGGLLRSMLIPYIETIRAAAGSLGGLPKLWRC